MAHESHLCSHGPASLLSWSMTRSLLSWSMRRRAVRSVVPTSKESGRCVRASLLHRTERNRSHDDECHRRALDVRDVRIYLPVIRIGSLRG